MKLRNQKTAHSQTKRPWWTLPVACLVTALALPVNAGIVIPDEPLTTESRVAPNILFILDDSGSMAWNNVNNKDVPSITGFTGFNSVPDAGGVYDGTDYTNFTNILPAMWMQSYATNTLYYNPNVTYQTWMGPDGNRISGGTSYTAAYNDTNYVTDGYTEQKSGTTNLANYLQTFYMPKDTSKTDNAYLSQASNYYRFQILKGATVIERGEFGKVVGGTTGSLTVSPSSGSVIGKDVNNHYTASVGVNVGVRITINATSRSTLYWMYDSNGVRICSGQVDGGNSVTCTGSSPVAGQYKIVARRWNNDENNYSKYNFTAQYFNPSGSNACDGLAFPGENGWIDCTNTNYPTTRTLEQEKTNFATWYSYHRDRIKAAKAGAAEAFRPLDKKVRVGYRTIWNRNNMDIPVASGDGRFYNDSSASITNRTQWYTHLFGAAASNATPLQKALTSAGEYFSKDDANGPYGPEKGADQLSCRQNFTILTTDGYWNDSIVPSGNQDGSDGNTIKGAKGATYQYTASAPYQDSIKDTLADVAMKYWKTDLRTESYMGDTSDSTTLHKNNVPTTEADPAFWQHMVTFTIALGLQTSKGWSSVEEAAAAISGGDSWPDPNTSSPGSDNQRRLDDLLHAAVNGHGTFVSASRPSDFTTGLQKALASIAQRTSSFSNVATNAASIKAGGKVFNASYVTGIWTGAVKAWTLDTDNQPTTQAWTATFPAAASRKVYTWTGTAGATFPTSAQTTALTRTGGPVDFPATGAENAAYIKGDGSKEARNGGLLRNRASTVMGDVVNSSPVYVGDTDTLYVGANDGMLHAFSASDGKELFAYVPKLVNMANLASISRGDYTHKWFVDGPVSVTDRTLTASANYLVGTMGRGGKGMFGLDVTTPATFGTSSVKWELPETPLGNMGLITGRPVLAQVNNATHDIAAVVGNGVNSTNNHAVLLVVNVKTGAVIREIDTGAGSATTPNGLSAPTGILGPDGRSLAYVYAGDRLGNVWKFDMTDASPALWTAKKLFTAKSTDGTGAVQPITGGVTIATNPRTYKRWVFFGTGSYVTTTEADDKTPLMQGMYGFEDTDAELQYTDLTKRTITNTGASQDGYPVRTFDPKADLSASTKGWYVSLPGNGERIVQDAQIVANVLVTVSMIPEGDACESGGTGYVNAVDAFTGTSLGKSFFDLDGDGDTTDSNIGGVPVGSVNYGVGMPTLPIFLDGTLIVGGTNAGEKPGSGRTARKSWSRVSWREFKGE